MKTVEQPVDANFDSQLRYVAGVMIADKYRDDWSTDNRQAIKAAGGKSWDFWRGAIETYGKLRMEGSSTRHPCPRFEIRGAPLFLAAIFEFVYDECQWFDLQATAYRNCSSGMIAIVGAKAADWVQIFWPNEKVFGRESFRQVAIQGRGWIPAGGPVHRRQRVSDIVNFSIIDISKRIVPRPSYRHLL